MTMSRPEPKKKTKEKHATIHTMVATVMPCGGGRQLRNKLFGLKQILKENEQLLNEVIRAADHRSAYSSSPAPPGNDFLKKKFAELYCKVKEDTDCIFCTEELTVDTMEVPDCGHVICKICCGKLLADETKNNKRAACPSCRRPLRAMVDSKNASK